jgi:endonuclease-3
VSIKDKAYKILKKLKNIYKNPKTELNYSTPFELLVATILSAQCTDKRVNTVTIELFKKYKNVYDFAKANQKDIEKEIKSCGFFHNKAKSIIETSKRIVDFYNGQVPDEMEELLTLRGVARKTANIILSSCFDKAQGIAVDTHVKRLSKRFCFTKSENPDLIEKDLMNIFDRKDWNSINYLLVNYGRYVCKAINPRCDFCELHEYCCHFKEKNKKELKHIFGIEKKIDNKIFITIKFAQSLDGKIATKSYESKWISNEKCLEFAHKLRSENDAILVGINTVIHDDPILNVRFFQKNKKSPIRIILDGNLKIPKNSKIVKTSKIIKTLIFCNVNILKKNEIGTLKKINELKKNKIKIIGIKTCKKNNALDLNEVLNYLYKKLRIKTLLVEGGGEIITNFYKKFLFDKIFVIINPIFIGNDGISAIKNLNIDKIEIAKGKKLKLIGVKNFDDNFIFELSK